MSGGNWTPGPWEAEEVFVYAPLKGACIVSGVGAPPRPEQELEANAHLIAAAPDLYEALQLAVDDDELATLEGAGSMSPETRKRVRAAIAKARGEKS